MPRRRPAENRCYIDRSIFRAFASDAGLTQRSISRQVNIGENRLSDALSRVTPLPVEIVERVARVLGVKAETIAIPCEALVDKVISGDASEAA
jgi:hypothetical protein